MTTSNDDVQQIQELGKARDQIVAEIRKVIVGIDDVVDEMMIAIFSRGHCLLVGVRSRQIRLRDILLLMMR